VPRRSSTLDDDDTCIKARKYNIGPLDKKTESNSIDIDQLLNENDQFLASGNNIS